MPDKFQPGLFSKDHIVQVRGELIDLSVPRIMGVLNITPDSFYAGSRVSDLDQLRKKITQFIEEGADFIDIGAYSSRPGAENIDETIEKNRLQPVLQIFRDEFPSVILSVDTFRSGIARMAVENYGVAIVNDISAGTMDKEMMATVASLGVPYIMMHMQGTPQTMQINPVYKNLLKEIIGFFATKIAQARETGIKDIIIDPGFGFGKTLDHNYRLLRNLEVLKIVECPVMVGLSRKSMIYRHLDMNPEDALHGTIALNAVALMKGAGILRVHDVKEAMQVVRLFSKMMEFPPE